MGTTQTSQLGFVPAPASNGVTNGDSHDHSGGDGATIPIGGGGTGQTTAQAAIDALTQASGGVVGQVLKLDADNHAVWDDESGGVMTDGGTYVKPATDGDTLRAYDSGGSDYAELQHDVLVLSPRTSAPSSVAGKDLLYDLKTEVAAAYTYTKLLLHCNGDDGSTTFTDEIGKTVTANGNVQLDTDQKKFGTASALFDGAGDWLSLATSADWAFGTGAFTVDFWIRFNTIDTSNTNGLFYSYYDDNNYFNFAYDGANHEFLLYHKRSGTVAFVYWDDYTLSINTWYHIEISRSAATGWSDFRLFINGTLQTQTGTSGVGTYDNTDVGQDFRIGISSTSGSSTYGWIDEFRVSKGIARHTSNFSVETAEYGYDVAASTTYDLTWMDGTGATHVLHTVTY